MRPLHKLDPRAGFAAADEETPGPGAAGPGARPVASPALLLQDRVAASIGGQAALQSIADSPPIPAAARLAIIVALAAAAWAPFLLIAQVFAR